MDAHLSITGLGKSFYPYGPGEPVTVFEDLNFSCERGAFISIVGANGCGKSTLLRIIAGLETPTRGTILVSGQPISPQTANLGMVFQDHGLFPWRTVRENIATGLEFRRVPRARREQIATEYVRAFGLEDFGCAYPGELSGGMRQKVAIARALAVDPDLVLMDEPFSSLDSQTRNALQAFLLEVWARRRDTVVFVTHNVDEALYLSDKVVIMAGRPTQIKDVVDIDPPRPRDRTGQRINAIRKHILGLLEESCLEHGMVFSPLEASK